MRIRGRRPAHNPLPLPVATCLVASDPSTSLAPGDATTRNESMGFLGERKREEVLHRRDGDLPTDESRGIGGGAQGSSMAEKEEAKEEHEMSDGDRSEGVKISHKRFPSGVTSLKEPALSDEKIEMLKPMGSKLVSVNGCTSVDCDIAAAAKEAKKSGVSKRRRSPSVLMEGSRCSRVNGRGWRCCQPTLVGYSLCEHHLGKGRLRSISSVKGQLGCTDSKKISIASPTSGTAVSNGSWNANVMMLEYEETLQNSGSSIASSTSGGRTCSDNNMVLPAKKLRRKKTTTLKARSINSLLDETDGCRTTSTEPPGADQTVQQVQPCAGEGAVAS